MLTHSHFMVKIGSLRKRYILFSLLKAVKKDEFEREIYKQALRFFGEYGFSKAAFKLIEFDGEKGMIRCEREHLKQTLGFLALLEEPRIKVSEVSGTIKGLKRKDKDG